MADLPFSNNNDEAQKPTPPSDGVTLPGQQAAPEKKRHDLPPELTPKPTAPATSKTLPQQDNKPVLSKQQSAIAPSKPNQPAKTETASVPLLSGKACLELARKLHSEGISDLHLRMGYPPRARRHGQMVTLGLPYVSDKTIFDFIHETVPFRALQTLDGRLEADYAFELPGDSRFRVNLFYETGRPGIVLRVIPKTIPQLANLGLPPLLDQFCHLNTGMVLVTGPTGSGKSTTLAAMLNQINLTYPKHIVTVEDPIEFVHRHKKCVVTQRELGSDTESFATGVKYALRQDPDVILIGEMRDAETIRQALIAAETGHLVFGTVHTTDAVQTINRVINAFEPHHREPIRAQLADVLRGTVSMRLLPKKAAISNSETMGATSPTVATQNLVGRVPIVEVMSATSTVTDYIKRNDIDAIYELLNQTEELGEMVSLNHSLYNAVQRGLIDPDIAIEQSNNPVALSRKLRGVR